MELESRELVRAFLRKWSTKDIDEDTRFILKEEVISVRILLEVQGSDHEILKDAEHAPNRDWFAKKFQEFTVQ